MAKLKPGFFSEMRKIAFSTYAARAGVSGRVRLMRVGVSSTVINAWSNKPRVRESKHHLPVKWEKTLVNSYENLSRFKFNQSVRELAMKQEQKFELWTLIDSFSFHRPSPQASRFVYLDKFSLKFSSSSFAVHLNLLHPEPSLFLFGFSLPVWCCSTVINNHFYVSFNLKVILYITKLTDIAPLNCVFLWNCYVCRSDVIWEEQKKKGRWKALKVRISDELEAAWTRIQQDLSVEATPNYIYKTGDMEVSIKCLCVVCLWSAPVINDRYNMSGRSVWAFVRRAIVNPIQIWREYCVELTIRMHLNVHVYRLSWLYKSC